MSCIVSISAQRIDLEEFALCNQQFPVREEVFAVNADPRLHLGYVVLFHLARKNLTRLDVEGRLFARVSRVDMRFLMAFPLFGRMVMRMPKNSDRVAMFVVSLCCRLFYHFPS